MKYDLKTPCVNCPFRTDCPKAWLGGPRAQEIAQSLDDRHGRGGGVFPCHKTTQGSFVDDDEEGERYVPQENEQHCAGALIFIEKSETPNQMMRLAERLEFFKFEDLNMEAPVFESVEAFIEHHDHGGRRGAFFQIFGRLPIEDDEEGGEDRELEDAGRQGDPRDVGADASRREPEGRGEGAR